MKFCVHLLIVTFLLNKWNFLWDILLIIESPWLWGYNENKLEAACLHEFFLQNMENADFKKDLFFQMFEIRNIKQNKFFSTK